VGWLGAEWNVDNEVIGQLNDGKRCHCTLDHCLVVVWSYCFQSDVALGVNESLAMS